MKLPRIQEKLLVQELPGEVLIYDQATHKSYCLNETAKVVFNHCDGVKTFADLNLPDEIIYFTLDELKKQNLIQDDYISHFAGMNRRDVIRKVGLASMVALPIISSLIAPTAASAVSGNCAPLCIPAGQDVCANCQGAVNLVYYAANTGCTGGMQGGNAYTCNSSVNNPSNDTQRS